MEQIWGRNCNQIFSWGTVPGTKRSGAPRHQRFFASGAPYPVQNHQGHFGSWSPTQIRAMAVRHRTLGAERVILLWRLLAVKKWLEPPHMTHIVGFCSMWTMPGSCQNLEKSIQVVARADLAPPPVCPLFQSFCFYWISLYLLSDLWPRVISYLSWHVFSFFLSDFSQSAIGFAARSSFAFVTTSHQLLQGNTAAFKHEFLSYSCIEQMK